MDTGTEGGQQDVDANNEEDVNDEENETEGQLAAGDNGNEESPDNSQPLFENNDSWDASTVKCQQASTGGDKNNKTPR